MVLGNVERVAFFTQAYSGLIWGRILDFNLASSFSFCHVEGFQYLLVQIWDPGFQRLAIE